METRHMTYTQRLEYLELPSLWYWRLRGDMIKVFKIINGIDDINCDAQTSHHSLSHISFPLEIHDIPHHFAHSAWCTITPPPTYLSANPYQPPFLAWTSGRIPTKWSISLLPGGRDCWLPHDLGAGLCWQHVGGVGSTTTTTTT